MKANVWLGIAAVVVGAGVIFWSQRAVVERKLFSPTPSRVEEGVQELVPPGETGETFAVVAENLSIPWEVVWLPDGTMLVTERPGRLVKIGTERVVIPIEGVRHVGEGGLLGMALHPEFSQNGQVYLYLTSQTQTGIRNRVERYTLEGNRLSERKVILEGIPGSSFHDGGRIAFGPTSAKASAFAEATADKSAGEPDKFQLYITTGDAGQEKLAQDTNSLAGKILRINEDGSVPADNPFGNAVYSYGHRNSQGLAWDDSGNLWATEHGRSGVQSGFDELNLIEKGKNYGWPDIQGDEEQAGMEKPVVHSGASDTWAPSGMVFIDGHLLFAGLRGESIYDAELQGRKVVRLRRHLSGQLGRLRTVTKGPDGKLYIVTNNTDGRGKPRSGDDQIVRISPSLFEISE